MGIMIILNTSEILSQTLLCFSNISVLLRDELGKSFILLFLTLYPYITTALKYLYFLLLDCCYRPSYPHKGPGHFNNSREFSNL